MSTEYHNDYDDAWSDAFSDSDEENPNHEDDIDDDKNNSNDREKENDNNPSSSSCGSKFVLFCSTILLVSFSIVMYQKNDQIWAILSSGGGSGATIGTDEIVGVDNEYYDDPGMSSIELDHGNINNNGGGTQIGESKEQRPVIYTFFERVERDTGMTDEGNEELLDAWVQAWTEAGWKPVILQLQDAQRHPDYDQLSKMLDDFKFDDYNKMCFIRWIAMGAAAFENGGNSGGWMADYDVFPLNPFQEEGFEGNLPNGGRLTVHQNRVRKKAVPSLVSGSREEWTRMAHLLVENYVDHMDEAFWTDMFALQDLGKQVVPYDDKNDDDGNSNIGEYDPHYHFEVMASVVSCEAVLQEEQPKEDACQETEHKRGIHFSHYGLENGVLFPGETLDKRAEIASRWTEWWRENCEFTEPVGMEEYVMGDGYDNHFAADAIHEPVDEHIYPVDVHHDNGKVDDINNSNMQPAPVIYTFFERIKQGHEMTDEGDDRLIAAWTDAWSEAGWEPIILNYDDARKHPRYDKMATILEDFKFGEFDKLCFLRWIAMGAVGGGWMADYDVFPLNSFTAEGFVGLLPNGGKLTVYGDTIYARHHSAVPSLVSGSGSEWTTMADRLINSYKRNKEEDHWSDMHALQHLNIDTFEVIPSVAVVSDVLQGGNTRDEACEVTQYMRAIHFSHYALHHSVLQPGETVNDRPEIATRWLRWWKENCGSTEVSSENAST